jgi:hypothetical protein
VGGGRPAAIATDCDVVGEWADATVDDYLARSEPLSAADFDGE